MSCRVKERCKNDTIKIYEGEEAIEGHTSASLLIFPCMLLLFVGCAGVADEPRGG